MKQVTIAHKLGGLAVVSLTLLVVVAWAGLSSTSAVGDDADHLSRTPSAMRGASYADMYHDIVNTLVVNAVDVDDPASVPATKTDVRVAIGKFNAELDRAKRADVSDAVGTAVDRVRPDVAAYGTKAQAVLDAIATRGHVEILAADFHAQFKKLERELPGISDAVDAATKDARAGARSSVDSGRQLTLGLLAAAAAILALLSLKLSRSIIPPLRRTAVVLTSVAEGDLTGRVASSGDDEVGRMGRALDQALDNLSATLSEIGNHSATLASASEELSAVSSQLAGAAQETSAQAGIVASAAGQVSENVAVVAAGTGEMTASIQEISHGAQDAVNVADQAAQVAQATNETVAKLGVSSAEIGNVVKVITSIAEQTNLLALNATIEAARAGEAGKGFAVVAHEVKELASATAAATADISERIGAIQGDAAESVRAIGEITEIIGRVGETQASIASAVEEQTATTNEIGRNVAEAADNSTEIARNISGVAQSAQDASMGASNTLDTAAELSRMAGELQVLVSGFRC
ncbi:MAG: methyl-accepting chemotaxis protein [Acidimicrobiales bacterium]